MKKVGILFFLLSVCVSVMYAKDDGKSFQLIIPETEVISNSLYNDIEFLDSRTDYEYEMLRIDRAMFTGQLNTLLHRLTDSTAHDGVLFFQLRDLSLEKSSNNTGDFVHLRVTLFERINTDYLMINSIDEKIPVPKSKWSAEVMSDAITNVITSNLKQAYTDPKPFNLDNIYNIAFFEKENLRLYNTKSLTDGVYTCFSDFADQIPSDLKMIPKFKKSELKEIKIVLPGSDKEQKPEIGQIYAVVIDGQSYIAAGKKYIPMYKDGDDFYFEDEVSNNKVGFAPSFSVGFGSGGYRGAGIGLGIYTKSDKQKMNFKIDHINGDFVPVLIENN